MNQQSSNALPASMTVAPSTLKQHTTTVDGRITLPGVWTELEPTLFAQYFNGRTAWIEASLLKESIYFAGKVGIVLGGILNDSQFVDSLTVPDSDPTAIEAALAQLIQKMCDTAKVVDMRPDPDLRHPSVLEFGDIVETIFLTDEFVAEVENWDEGTFSFCVDDQARVRTGTGIVAYDDASDADMNYVPRNAYEVTTSPANSHSAYLEITLPNPAVDPVRYTRIREAMLDEISRRMATADAASVSPTVENA
ncbi:hypothetical protein [Paraburkholderia sp. SIMBA_054]|uniref:hypothetical protein n=1 Tax=Paraburkholderia sp. SIMBA_054 TaxID=3085795 RepID=UPI00397A19A8